MTAKQYLRQLRNIKGLIAAKEEKIQELRARSSLSRNVFAQVPHTGFTRDRMSGLVVKLCDLEAKLVKDKIRLVELEKDIIGRIDALEEPAYRELLTLRYVNGHKWEKIALKLRYNYQWVHKLHARALRQFEKMI